MLEHAGHRKRILEKLKQDKVTEHEYLEILLFNAVPRRNTNDLAHRLLSEFGCVYNIFTAPYENLLKVDGVGESVASYLYCVGRFFKQYQFNRDDITACGIGVYDKKAFISYIRREYESLPYERLDVYLLDGDSRIIGVKSHSVSSVGEVLVDPDFFLKLLVSHSPSGIVLAHNHPKGNCAPSQEDDNATKQLMYLCKVHNILFCEHCIYGLDGVYSYSESKRLLEIAKMINKDW